MSLAHDGFEAVERLAYRRIASSRKSGKERCERDWHWMPQPLPDYDLWYVAGGEGSIAVNGAEHTVATGSCLTLRPGDHVRASHDPQRRLTVFFVHFTIRDLTPSGAHDTGLPHLRPTHDPLDGLPRCAVIQDKIWMETLLCRLVALDDEDRDVVADEFDAVVRTAISLIARESAHGRSPERQRHPAVRLAMRLIRDNPAAPFDRKVVAAHAGLTPRYLNELFKSQIGVSLKTFVARTRIERACRLLAESEMSVTRIAESLGYSDLYFFSKHFKQWMGESPVRYRERMQAVDRWHG